ncbi:hypothetical protein M0R45_037765 [Rubus argutus]|uniref:Uncharacterized protein n=1 Tax=Rubus argutus TaxID=59490 RepID=A0AAW1W1G8_RUBAR
MSMFQLRISQVAYHLHVDSPANFLACLSSVLTKHRRFQCPFGSVTGITCSTCPATHGKNFSSRLNNWLQSTLRSNACKSEIPDDPPSSPFSL